MMCFKKKVAILLLSALFFSKVTIAQLEVKNKRQYGNCENLTDSKFIMFGEMHFSSDETLITQKMVLDQLSSVNKPINIFLELSPACVFFTNQYLNTGNEKWLRKTASVKSGEFFFKYLRQIKDSLEFNIIGIDLEPRRYFQQTKLFLKKFVKDTTSAFFFKIEKTNSKRKLIKILRNEIENNRYTNFKYESKTDSLLLHEEIRILLKHGFIIGGRMGKRAKWRADNMALMLTKYYSAECSNFLTIGRAHLEPEKYNSVSSILNRLTWTRDEIFIITQTYAHSNVIVLDRKVLYENEFNKIIEDRIFDCIIVYEY